MSSKNKIMEMENEKDKMLWKEAKRRVGFRNHLMTYLSVNAFFWLVWWFNDFRHDSDSEENHSGIPWPLFSMFGWGFGLFWHFVGVYMRGNQVDQVEKEYERLKKKQDQGN